MRKQVLVLSTLLFLAQGVLAQEQITETPSDVKTGWNFGALPALGYDSNLGLLYGGIISMFDYGDGSAYPNYDHNLYLQLSAYTRGSMDAIMFFDSYSLIPEKHFTARLSYNHNRAYPFYGFNGGQTLYNSNVQFSDHADFISQVFYKLDRKVVKGDLILQDKFGNSDFNWMLGLDLGYYKTASVDVEHLNRKNDADNLISDADGLYDHYVDWGFITAEEQSGGFDNSLKLGLVYDTRDRLTNPMKGTWTEVITRVSPSFLGNYSNFARLSIIHRQYFTLIKDDLSFAYRIWYEGSFGNSPFYSRQYLTASNYYEGMGGSNTVRGVLLNRVVGKQTAIANAELRWKALRFKAINQNFYLGFNAFSDFGYVIEKYDMDFTAVNAEEMSLFFNEDNTDFIVTPGLGLKIVMNENFVISGDWAKTFDENYGSTALYIQMGYIF